MTFSKNSISPATLRLPGWGRMRGVIVSGRGSGKMAAHRKGIADALAAGEHVHVAGRDGYWCVEATGIGPLWKCLRRPCPDRHPRTAAGFYEQVVRGARR